MAESTIKRQREPRTYYQSASVAAGSTASFNITGRHLIACGHTASDELRGLYILDSNDIRAVVSANSLAVSYSDNVLKVKNNVTTGGSTRVLII